MEGGTGELVGGRVRALIDGAVQKHAKRSDFIDRVRKQRQAEKLAAFKEKQLKKAAPLLKLAFKGLWTNVTMDSGPRREKKGWSNFREDPVKKRRRLTRGIEFEELEKYDEEGEPIWARIEMRR